MNQSSVTLTTYQAWDGHKWVPQPAPPVTAATGEGWEREPPWRCSQCKAPLTGDDTFSIIGGVVYCDQHSPRTTYCVPPAPAHRCPHEWVPLSFEVAENCTRCGETRPLSVAAWLDARTPHDRLEARVEQLGEEVAALRLMIKTLELRFAGVGRG